MIELLLSLGCNVNEVVHIHGNRTVWDSYLYHLYSSTLSMGNVLRHQKPAWLLVSHGAEHTGKRVRPEAYDKNRHGHDDAFEVQAKRLICMEQMLLELFGQREAEDMQKQILMNVGIWKWSAMLSWLGPKHKTFGAATQFSWTNEPKILESATAELSLGSLGHILSTARFPVLESP